MRLATILLAALACTACGTASAQPEAPPPVASLPAVTVMAAGETEPVGTANRDAADDPAIWRNPADPAASLIVATDKQAGLYVYGLDGKVRSFNRVGRVNNVDVADMGAQGVIVGASDRNDPAAAKIQLFRLDTAAAKLVPLGTVDAGAGEGYGFCFGEHGHELRSYSVLKDGTIREHRLDLAGAATRATLIRTRKLATQAEGCVVDPRDGTLYVGEEDVGIWRFPRDRAKGKLVAPADGKQLVADTEGLALMPDGAHAGWLVASSQGDSAYAVYRLPDAKPVGRFRIAAGTFGATEHTDGIDLVGGVFDARFPEGLLVAQDGDNQPQAQNFKLVSWRAILDALRQ